MLLRPEVAPLEVLLDGQIGVGGDQDVLVAARPPRPRPGRFAAGRRRRSGRVTVNLIMPKLLPTRSTRPCCPRRRTIVSRSLSGDEQVDVGGGAAEDEVADEAADGVDVRRRRAGRRARRSAKSNAILVMGPLFYQVSSGRRTSPGPPWRHPCGP
ncbi:MAG: hypothetical protein MZV64_22665 [Ignavibacteriales bacterium]|nr:hypothetical protein [Ignavibacteriales bacterium]